MTHPAARRRCTTCNKANHRFFKMLFDVLSSLFLITSQGNDIPDLPEISPYKLEPTLPTVGWSCPSSSPLRSNAKIVVQEY